MTIKNQYSSRTYIRGKRLYTMRGIAEDAFGEQLIDVHIDSNHQLFIIKIESNTSAKQIKAFTDKYHGLCRIIPFKRLDLNEICKECK